MSSLQQAQRLAQTVRLLDEVAGTLRRRALAAMKAGKIDFDQYEEVGDQCDQVVRTARGLDRKVQALALDGLDAPLAQLHQATERLEKAHRRIEKVGQVLRISGKLLIAALAVAAMAGDPTKVTAVAAASAIADVAMSIDELAG